MNRAHDGHRLARPVGRLAVGALAVTLGFSLSVPSAAADSVAAKQARAAQLQQATNKARSDVQESRSTVASATERLLQSQSQLDAARAKLSALNAQVNAAVAHDRDLGRSLDAARNALSRAKAEVEKGEAAIAAQLRLMGTAAREAFQQQSPFTGLTVVFESQTPAQLAQRLQWNTTIFDVQSAEKARLDTLQRALQAARDRQADEEQRVSRAKDAAAAQVQLVTNLRGQAASQTATVQALVTENTKNRRAAQSELDADQAAYRAYAAQESALRREIRRQIALERAEAQRLAREAAARKAREAARRAARAGSHAPVAADVPPAASDYGFIRPVDASPGSPFGRRFHPILHVWRMHQGNDWGAACGTPIYAARSGKVLMAGRHGGFGNFVLIGHGDINGRYVTTGYGHQSRIAVHAGQRVKTGQLIGYVGSTGLSTVCHLHLEVRLDGDPVNPMLWIP